MECVAPIRKQKWIIEHIEIKSFFSCKTVERISERMLQYNNIRYRQNYTNTTDTCLFFTHTSLILSCFSRHWRMQRKVVSMQSRLSERKWKLHMCLWRWIHFRSRFCYMLRYLFSFIQRGSVILIKFKCLTHSADYLGWALWVSLLIFHFLLKRKHKNSFWPSP